MDRGEQILEYLKNHNLVTVAELVKSIGVSPATIRRDLIHLCESGRICRVHGGVTLNRFVPAQPSVSEKLTRRHEEKIRIGAAAAELIHPEDSVILDAGTTTYEVANNLIDKKVKVITNDLNIALLLSASKDQEILMSGGIIDCKSQSCTGSHACELFAKVHPTFVFVACNSWMMETGVTTPTYEKSVIKHQLSALPNTTHVLVADSSKYGLTSLYEVCPLSAFEIIITDSNLNPEAAEKIRSAGIQLILC